MKCKECGKELKASDTFCINCGNKIDKQKRNVKILPIIVISIIVFFVIPIVIIGIITNSVTSNIINDTSKDLNEAQNDIYEIYGGKENYEKEKLFEKICDQYNQERLTVIDVEFEENSENPKALFVKKTSPNRLYKWADSGIPEENYNEIPDDAKKELTAYYGPAFIYNDKIEYLIYDIKTGQYEYYESLEQAVNMGKWNGYKQNRNLTPTEQDIINSIEN